MFNQVAENFRQSGYPECKLYSRLVKEGNAAAAEFPDMERILGATLLPQVL